jgi:hypothetical protein
LTFVNLPLIVPPPLSARRWLGFDDVTADRIFHDAEHLRATPQPVTVRQLLSLGFILQ